MTMLTRRSFLLVISALPVLSGCGFRPLYGSQGAGGEGVSVAGVAVAEQDNRAGQLVRNELLQAMTGDGGRYTLKMTVKDQDRAKSSLPGTATTRYDVTLTAQYQLVDQTAGGSVARGTAFSTVSYDTVRQPVADRQARAAAVERAAIELAGDLRLRVAVYLSKHP